MGGGPIGGVRALQVTNMQMRRKSALNAMTAISTPIDIEIDIQSNVEFSCFKTACCRRHTKRRAASPRTLFFHFILPRSQFLLSVTRPIPWMSVIMSQRLTATQLNSTAFGFTTSVTNNSCQTTPKPPYPQPSQPRPQFLQNLDATAASPSCPSSPAPAPPPPPLSLRGCRGF